MKKREKTRQIERYIAKRILDDSRGVTRATAEAFGISRQAAHRHIQGMIQEGLVAQDGVTKGREYHLLPLRSLDERFPLTDNPQEDIVWRQHVAALLSETPENVRSLCNYGFTEIFNNAVEHSEGQWVSINATVHAAGVEMTIRDDGVGIFRKIQRYWDLPDEREALFQLTKGKLTTDATHHSGEGIFFTSRICDVFRIDSGSLTYRHENDGDVATADREVILEGTSVRMRIAGDTTRTMKGTFDQYAAFGDSYAFSKTRLSVQLLLRANEQLISRSQGKRLLTGIEGFKEVILDFNGVEEIGQAFADEVFRVFPSMHPGVELTPVHASDQIVGMIRRAESSAL